MVHRKGYASLFDRWRQRAKARAAQIAFPIWSIGTALKLFHTGSVWSSRYWPLLTPGGPGPRTASFSRCDGQRKESAADSGHAASRKAFCLGLSPFRHGVRSMLAATSPSP